MVATRTPVTGAEGSTQTEPTFRKSGIRGCDALNCTGIITNLVKHKFGI